MRLRNVARAVRNINWSIPGICPVCGRWTLFVCVDPPTARNNMQCLSCKSISRKRHVSQILLRELFPGVTAVSRIPHETKLKVLSASLKDPWLHYLQGREGFIFSDLLPDLPKGAEIAPNSFCQDLEALTFPSGSFDAVITEDVLEHVRNEKLAFREIHRVLKHGGMHIFTVPFLFDQRTIVRVDTSGPEDVFLTPPEYHGDPLRGAILAYRTFGVDMYDMLEEIGFATSVERTAYIDFRRGILDSYVFVSRKN